MNEVTFNCLFVSFVPFQLSLSPSSGCVRVNQVSQGLQVLRASRVSVVPQAYRAP